MTEDASSPAAPDPKRRRDRRQGLLLLLLAGILTAAATILIIWNQLTPVSAGLSTTTEFEVLPGWDANRTAAALSEAGLIRNARLFSLYLRLRDLDTRIGEGLYDLDPAMSAAEIAAALVAGGRPRTTRVVLPEGLRASEVAARLAAAGLGELTDFLARIAEPNELRPPYLPPDSGLEGFLFPASYDIPTASTPDEILNRLIERFAQVISSDVTEALSASGLTVHDWVTLGSIVQAEAGSTDEMPVIAGVFLNRLEIGMALQSDPTVAYGLNKGLPELDASAGDFEQDHPWNTYTRGGLPAGPIGNPGAEALMAVLAPQRENPDGHPYLYFMHGFDGGEPIFRPNTSLTDHNRDIGRYLRP